MELSANCAEIVISSAFVKRGSVGLEVPLHEILRKASGDQNGSEGRWLGPRSLKEA